jgi:predicted DCC family thiol-disulfide oxidoreductase YuxK
MKLQNESHYKIILFDGVCNFCNYLINFILDRDDHNQFRFAAFQSEKGSELLTQFNIPQNEFDSFILISQDKVLNKSSAAFRIVEDLGGWLNIFLVFKIFPLSFNNFVYDFIAKNRYAIFGKNENCRILTSEEKNKFL